MRDGERQVAPDLSGIRRDHLARYTWAAKQLPRSSRVIDVACGVGYGAFILANAGHRVTAIDNDAEAISYAMAHYAHPNVDYRVADAGALAHLQPHDAATCFETIEHLADPLPLLQSLRCAPLLLASVPDERHFPYRGYRFHHRHYTRVEFEQLLGAAGFLVTQVRGQRGPQSQVGRRAGRTLIVMANRINQRSRAHTDQRSRPRTSDQVGAGAIAMPRSVAILGLGPSLATYLHIAKCAGARGKVADEIWGINALGDVIACDRVFHMDDVRIQEIRAKADPDGNIAAMLPWLRKHPGPVYTSRPHPDYPGLVAFPLADVLNSCAGQRYFNSTAAYAVAFAIHLGVKKILLFGIDFTYANAHHAEAGRACVEFWLGLARGRGIDIVCAGTSSLLDAAVAPARRLYGYDTLEVKISGGRGAERVRFKPRVALPTAEEIEDRYDHSHHPNPLVNGRL